MTNAAKRLRVIAAFPWISGHIPEIATELRQIADEWEREHEDDDQLAEQEMQLANERDTLRQENERLKAELAQAHTGKEPPMANQQVYIDIDYAFEGHSIYINDIRVAGPKPWSGGNRVHHFLVDVKDIEEALNLANREA